MSPPHGRVVNEVVMDQRGGVEQFNAGSDRDDSRERRLAQMGGEQRQDGAQAFAAAVDDSPQGLRHLWRRIGGHLQKSRLNFWLACTGYDIEIRFVYSRVWPDMAALPPLYQKRQRRHRRHAREGRNVAAFAMRGSNGSTPTNCGRMHDAGRWQAEHG